MNLRKIGDFAYLFLNPIIRILLPTIPPCYEDRILHKSTTAKNIHIMFSKVILVIYM